MTNIFILGDSISLHYGIYLNRILQNTNFNYDRLKSKELINTTLYEIPANGGSSDMLWQSIQELYKDRKTYDIILFNCGLWDVRIAKDDPDRQTAISLDAYRQNLDLITDYLLKMAKTVVFITTTGVIDAHHNSQAATNFYRYQKDIDAFNQAAEEIMITKAIKILDLASFTKNLGQKEIYFDHVHFNKETRERQAEFIYSYLQMLVNY